MQYPPLPAPAGNQAKEVGVVRIYSSLFILIILSLFALSGCGTNQEEWKDSQEWSWQSEGTLALINGQVQKIDESQKEELCREHFCEPNYIYSIEFARRKPVSPPAPKPTPTVTPQPPVSAELSSYSHKILKTAEAWKKTKGSKEVIVAVVDTGVDVAHPDLAANIYVNEQEQKGATGVDDDGNGYVDDVYGYDFANNKANALDDQGHGTHCAGIIGAELNGVGIAGVAPVVKIMPVKFLSSNGSGTTEAAIKAIEYAVANGAQIISNSWGGGPRSELLAQAIQRAIDKGILVVAAAGNSAMNTDFTPHYPSAYPGVISVGSTDDQDKLSTFSNHGVASVLIAAPGTKINSTVPGGLWAEKSGTSMATPQVAGALALALSLKSGLGVNVYTDLLCQSSSKILTDKVKCGRMDVAAFLQSL